MRWKTLAALPLAIVIASPFALAADLGRVRSLAEAGQPEAALADVDEHLEESPVDPEAMFLRALLLAEMQRQDEAREVFEEVAGLRPDRPEPLNNLAVLQAAMGDYDAAVETLKEALGTHPAYRTAYENLTKIYGQLASEAYSRALSVDDAHDRSSVELVLMSEMVLPETEPVQVAHTPIEPLPSAADAGSMAPPLEMEADTDEAVAEADMAVEPAAESVTAAGEAPVTPDRAIEEALRQGRDLDSEPAVMESSSEAMGETVAESGELAALVGAWARAWSEQRVEDYLYFYSEGFQPEGDMSRDDWEQLRRARVAAPEFVKVSVAILDFEASEPERVLVRFNQSYESSTFSDVVTKTLELVRENGDWKIARESVDS
ncbi:MAG: tetratricopeptide repeat protein [bacterium]|nr:tetratricopeptide repeat protein [bacterium]